LQTSKGNHHRQKKRLRGVISIQLVLMTGGRLREVVQQKSPSGKNSEKRKVPIRKKRFQYRVPKTDGG